MTSSHESDLNFYLLIFESNLSISGYVRIFRTYLYRDMNCHQIMPVRFKNSNEYDNFLLTEKNGTIRRIGEFVGMSVTIEHECADEKCGRKWKQKPISVTEDDYYCPSCVLHHRNNMERFKIARLEWTKNVPNTFYVFKITDPKFPEIKLVKFGRTQNRSALKRYQSKELKDFKMELICELRGKLITMTRIENYWKHMGKKLDAFHAFSDSSFHGKSECIKSDSILDKMIRNTHLIYSEDSMDPDDMASIYYDLN